MHKDLKSYAAHDREFHSELNSYDATLGIIKKYDEEKQFEKLGFALALKLTTVLPKIHIDIGSGNGWLLRKMSPYFEKCIGIEPSEAGSTLSLKINSENKNVSVVNKDMIDGMEYLNITKPVFITTSTVLNHIENYHVGDFLKKVNELPHGSVLYFDERYEKTSEIKMWHVRSKDWWRDRLPNWQVIFLDINVDAYPSGIYALCLKEEKLKNVKSLSFFEKITWRMKQLARKIKWAIR
jgi:hypothetical protein